MLSFAHSLFTAQPNRIVHFIEGNGDFVLGFMDIQFGITFVAELPAALNIILAVGNRRVLRDAGIASATIASFGFCVGCLYCLVLSFLPEQFIRVVFHLRCLSAQRKGEVEVLSVIAAAFRVVEHNRQIAVLPDFKGIIGGGNILPSSLLSSPLFCPNTENTG